MFGRVTKYFEDKGYGFIRGENGQTYFIHRSRLEGEYIERGYMVNFDVYSSDRSDNNAMNVIVVEAIENIRKARKYGGSTYWN